MIEIHGLISLPDAMSCDKVFSAIKKKCVVFYLVPISTQTLTLHLK